MKATQLKKIFPSLQGKRIKVWLGTAEHIVTLSRILDARKPGHMEDLSVLCSDKTEISAGAITKIDLNPPAEEPEILAAPGEYLKYCDTCKKKTPQVDHPESNLGLICKICGQ